MQSVECFARTSIADTFFAASENDPSDRVPILRLAELWNAVRRLSAKHLKQFGQNIIRLRSEAGLTQEKLAEKIGISSRYFQSIEAGKRWPSIGVLLRLRNALRCEWADLFCGLH